MLGRRIDWAILLGSGGRGYSGRCDSAQSLLDQYGTLAGLMNRPLNEVAQVKGIKVVRAIRLAAAYEICSKIAQRSRPRHLIENS